MKASLLAALLVSPAVWAASQYTAVEVPPHFTFRDKPRICAECGTVRELQIHNRLDARPGKGLLIGTVIGAPKEHVDRGLYYRITVDMDDGKTRQLNVDNGATLGIGTKVRVVNGDIERSS